MRIRSVLIGAVAAAALAAGAQAATVFSDNFDSYTTGLNWSGAPNWLVPSGSVDLIGAGSGFDFYPGHGGYVDLEGTTSTPGTLQTLQTFAAGSYVLTFDLAGNARGDVDKTTQITLGNFTTTITLSSSSLYTLYTETFTTTGGQLSFADLTNNGNQNIGNILDNVTLSTAPGTLSAVPEPAAWAVMLLGLAMTGAGLRTTRRKGAMASA